MKTDDVISHLESFALEQREIANKCKRKNTTKPSPVSVYPWFLLDDAAKCHFESLCDSEYQSELRKEKGAIKNLLQIKLDKWAGFKNSKYSGLVKMKLTDENINAAFELYTKDEIIERLLEDKIWFKLSDRQLHRDDIEQQLSQHNEIMLDVIREGTTIKHELYKMALTEVEEIIADYEVNHAS